MCGHFIMVPRDVVENIVREIEIENHVNIMPDWPARHIDAYPQSLVPLIVSDEGRLVVEEMAWGYPAPWKQGVVFNTRSETALDDKGMWHDSILNRRCIVPSFGFFEPHRTEKAISERTGREIKRQYRFDTPDRLLFMAGVHEKGRFSILTTAPNDAVSPVHDRMPIVLHENELRQWLSPDFEGLFDRTGVTLTATPQQPLASGSDLVQPSLWE